MFIESLVGWVISKFADRAVKEVNDRYGKDESDADPIGDLSLTEQQFTSRFVRSERDMQTILSLRRAYFKRKVIVPDEAYRRCWHRNQFTFRLVLDDFGGPVGYWGIVPTTRDSFEAFVRGEVSHGTMLTDRCVPWASAIRDGCYLYIVGAVVPLTDGPGSKAVQQAISLRVILDSFSFGLELMQQVKFRGICGYPSRPRGLTILKKMGLEQSEVYVDNNKHQPVFSLRQDQMVILKEKMSLFTGRCRSEIPLWDSTDRTRFHEDLGIQEVGAEDTSQVIRSTKRARRG